MKPVGRALIGFTGFVGSNLLAQGDFEHRYNSRNISEICGRHYRLLVCAGAPAAKWKINQNPEEDWSNLQVLMRNLERVEAESVLLVSTVDVYPDPVNVDEGTAINPQKTTPYGRHRYYLEEFIRDRFAQPTIVRLPGLFGPGLKKNFIYDLLNSNALDWTNAESTFQFYDIRDFWHDAQEALSASLRLVNFATEPIRARDVAWQCFGIRFENVMRPPVHYRMESKFAQTFGSTSRYMYTADEVCEKLRDFVSTYRMERLK